MHGTEQDKSRKDSTAAAADGTDQHLIGTQAAIAVKVTAPEPVVQRHFTALVFLTHDEPNKVLVPHLARLF